MIEESSASTTYEITAQSLRAPWISRSMRQLLNQRRTLPSRRLGAALVGAVFAALVHVLLLGSILYGDAQSAPPKHARQGGMGSIQTVSESEPVMTLVLIRDPNSRLTRIEPEEIIASRGLAANDPAILIASPDPSALVERPSIDEPPDASAQQTSSDADRAARAALYLRYTGQIQARIERAWMRPRSALGADRFECRVQILQDRLGKVLQTTLQQCNGPEAWQLSLVQAIQRASPLPAPPNSEVFADELILTLTSAPYQPGADEEGFEPERRIAQAATIPALEP